MVGTTATPPPLLAQFGATSVSKSIPNVGPVTFNAVTVDGTQLVQSVATTRKLSRSHPPGVFPGPIVGGSFTLTET